MVRKSNINNTKATFSTALLLDHPGKGHVGGKLDAFTHKGPNGPHTCVTFEPLERSFETLLTKADLIQDGRFLYLTKYDPTICYATFVREICRQIILALNFSQRNRIMHRDIQPGNILLALTYDIHSMTETEIPQDLWEANNVSRDGEVQDQINHLYVVNESLDPQWQKMNFSRSMCSLNIMARLDGEPLHDDDPKYTAGPIPLPDRLTFNPPANFKCILNDLGSSCRIEDCNDGQIP